MGTPKLEEKPNCGGLEERQRNARKCEKTFQTSRVRCGDNLHLIVSKQFNRLKKVVRLLNKQ